MKLFFIRSELLQKVGQQTPCVVQLYSCFSDSLTLTIILSNIPSMSLLQNADCSRLPAGFSPNVFDFKQSCRRYIWILMNFHSWNRVWKFCFKS